MIREYRRALGSGPVQELTPSGRSLLRLKIEARIPLRLAQVDQMNHRIGEVKRLLFSGGNEQRHVAWRMPGRRDSVNTRHDLRLALDYVDLALDRRETIACEHAHHSVQFRRAVHLPGFQ